MNKFRYIVENSANLYPNHLLKFNHIISDLAKFMILPNLSSGQWMTRCTWKPLLTHSSNFFFSCNLNCKTCNSAGPSVCSCTGVDFGSSPSSSLATGRPGGELRFRFFRMLWQNLSSSCPSSNLFSWSLSSSRCWIFHFTKNQRACALSLTSSSVLRLFILGEAGRKAVPGNREECLPLLSFNVITSAYFGEHRVTAFPHILFY